MTEPYQANPLAVLKKRRMPGIVILDRSLNVLWVNTEAAAMGISAPVGPYGAFPENPWWIEVSLLVHRLLEQGDGSPDGEVAIHVDGDQAYGLRAQYLCPPEEPGPGGEVVLVHIDRVSMEREIDLDAVRRRYRISRREQDVLRMLYYGKSNREIAELLFISEYTVKDHIKAIMAKMGAASRSEVLYKLVVAA